MSIPALLLVSIVAIDLHGNMGCSDSRWSIPTAVSLLNEGNFDLDEFRPILETQEFYAIGQVNGHYYTIFPFGTSILAAPVVLLLRSVAPMAFRLFPSLRLSMERAQVERGCTTVGGEPVVDLHSWTEQVIASAIVALTAIVLFSIARQELSIASAALVALVFAFGTSAWSTASRSLWQHGPSMLLLSLALLLQRRRSHLFFTGMLLAFAYVVRPTNSIPLALTTAWVVVTEWRRLPVFMLGLGVVLVPFLANNQHIYGTWLSPYYHPGYFGLNPFFWDALAGSLVSPGRGLIVYSPVLIFAVAGVALKIQQRRFTLLDGTVAACVLLHWIIVARVNPGWWGGYSYGGRFLADIVPYLIYFIIPFVGWMTSATGTRRLVAGSAFTLAVTTSVLVHAQGVFNPQAILWNVEPITIDADAGRLWNWKYPPFLAGLIAKPNAGWDINAVRCEVAPGAPAEFRIVTNQDNTVVASWNPAPGAVALYVVESGTASGASDLTPREILDVSKPTITVTRIPAGTYYARVRAKNACGTSAPSNEIRVVVN